MFIIDSNVLMTAKNMHYPMKAMPGYWDWLERSWRGGLLASIEPVRVEVANGHDELVTWVEVHQDMFAPMDQTAIDALRRVARWANGLAANGVQRPAIDTFLRSCDSMLVAYCLAHGHTLVTYEQSAPEAKRNIKIPDACDSLGVTWTRPYTAFCDTGATLELSPSSRS